MNMNTNNNGNSNTNNTNNNVNNTNTNVYLAKQIKTEHQDLIQDIAYDFFGKRVATASLDQLVKIWNINDDNEWIIKEEIKIMPGLYKVAWAHPEFGQIIAVAQDRLVWIYEELCFTNSKNSQAGWNKRVPAFSDARAPISDIKFAPKYLGLQLVVTTTSGEARIYECLDNCSANAQLWSLQQEIKTNMASCSSCSFSTCLNLPILLAFGCDDPHTPAKLAIFEYVEGNRTYSKIDVSSTICQEPIRSIAFAPSVGKLFHTLAIASKTLMILTIKPVKDGNHKYSISSTVLDTDVATWRVCWNTVGSVLASAGDDRHVKLWKCNYMGGWKCFAEIVGDTCQARIDQTLHENDAYNKEKSIQYQQQQQVQQQQLQQQQQQQQYHHHHQSNNTLPPSLLRSYPATAQFQSQQSIAQIPSYYQQQTSITSSGVSSINNSSLLQSSHQHQNDMFHQSLQHHQQQQPFNFNLNNDNNARFMKPTQQVNSAAEVVWH